MPMTAIARRVRPFLLTAALIAAALILARTPPVVVQASAAAQAGGEPRVVGDGPNRAALAVSFGNGELDKVCVRFGEPEIGGDELLTRGRPETGLSFDGAVCSIGNEGCPSTDCFCKCADLGNCQYWAYYQWKENDWLYSQWGVLAMADAVIVRDGDMQAWVWGSGDDQTGPPPPQVTFDEICTSANANGTATPTLTPTTTATATATHTPPAQSTPPAARPQVTFTASARSIPAGQCTTLSWQVLDATSITLDGVPVGASGSQRECPQASHTWTLIATGAGGGQTSQTVTIQVTPVGTASPALRTATPTVQQGVGTPRPGLPTGTRGPIMTQAPGGFPAVGQGALTPTPGFFTPEPQQGGGVPLAPTAEVLAPPATPTLAGMPTRYIFELPPTETPRPRRALGAAAPTPTPLLVARAAGAGSGGAPAAPPAGGGAVVMGGSGGLVQARSFTPQLLPQYAAYIATVAALLAMGWFTLRRRNGHTSVMVAERMPDHRAPDTARTRGREGADRASLGD